MLFLDEAEIGTLIPPADRRVAHVSKVLRKGRGDELRAGTPDGRLGTAIVESLDDTGMVLSFRAEAIAPQLPPLALLLGFPRPIQANRILKDLCSLGLSRIVLSGTELGEKSYIQSDFFKHRQFRHALIEGAEQAANPRLPVVDTAWTLARALALPGLPGSAYQASGAQALAGQAWALDPYRGTVAFGSAPLSQAALVTGDAPLWLAVGSERGWTDAELDALAANGFSFATLGARILKSETAALVAASVALVRLGLV